MSTTRRTTTPTVLALLSLIALLLALLGGGTAAVAQDCAEDEIDEETVQCEDAPADDEDDGKDGNAGWKDVPDGLPHIEGIEWLTDAGMTRGCQKGAFCPNKPLTRGQFASFLLAYHELFVEPVTPVAPAPGDVATTEEQIRALQQQVALLQQQVDELEGR